MRQEVYREDIAIADFTGHRDLREPGDVIYTPAFFTFPELLAFVRERGIVKVSFMTWDDLENKLGVNWLETHTKVDSDELFRLLAARPKTRIPRGYGRMLYQSRLYHYAFFGFALGGRPIDHQNPDDCSRLVVVRGNIWRGLEQLEGDEAFRKANQRELQ